MRVFRWSWTANTTDLSSAQTFSPIMVPLHSAGLIPINELSRNEGGFCNSVCAAPSGCDQILFSFNHGVGLTFFRGSRGSEDALAEGPSWCRRSHSHTLSLGFYAAEFKSVTLVSRKDSVASRNTNLETHTNRLKPRGSCASYSDSGCWHCKLRRGGGYVRLGYAFSLFCFTLCSVNSFSQGWKQGTCVCMYANCSLLLQRVALINQRCSSVTFYHFWFNWTMKLSAPPCNDLSGGYVRVPWLDSTLI